MAYLFEITTSMWEVANQLQVWTSPGLKPTDILIIRDHFRMEAWMVTNWPCSDPNFEPQSV